MRVKNAFKILISYSAMIYKSVFYKLITTSIIGIISYFIVRSDLEFIFKSKELGLFWDAILNSVTTLLKDGIHPTLFEPIPQAFDAFLAMIKANMLDIFLAFLKVGLFLFLLNVIERMGNYAIGLIANNYMSSLSKYSLVATLIANFGSALVYALVISTIVLIYDGLILTIGLLMAVYGVRVISIFAVILALIFIVLAVSIKFTLFSRFMPSMITDKKSVGKALKHTFTKREKFFAMVGNYAFVVMISFYLNVSVAVFTFGAGLIVTLPLTSIFTVIVSFVDHYQIEGKKYYVSSEEVVTPRQMREHADLLKYM